jgi:uncharacterized protein (UPF0128 family)
LPRLRTINLGNAKPKMKKKEEAFNRKNLKFWNFDVQFGAIVGQSFGDSVTKWLNRGE